MKIDEENEKGKQTDKETESLEWEDYLRGAWQPLGENKKAFFIVLLLTKGQFKIRNIHAKKEINWEGEQSGIRAEINCDLNDRWN